MGLREIFTRQLPLPYADWGIQETLAAMLSPLPGPHHKDRSAALVEKLLFITGMTASFLWIPERRRLV